MPTTIISPDSPLREMLEHTRLAVRDQRLSHVINALRVRADAYESAPRPLRDAIAGFSAERSALRRRLGELERGGAGVSAPAGRVPA